MQALMHGAAVGWQASLRLGFTAAAMRTQLARNWHQGPLRVQRPFHPDADGCCHVYLLHPPGGVVGGDGLSVEVELGPGARALLTTPSANRFYRSNGPHAGQTQVLRVAAGARLDWLPQETIVFSGARLRTTTRLELQGDAAACAWELVCLGRPAAGESFVQGAALCDFEVWHDGLPWLLERNRFEAGHALLQAPWGLRGGSVIGTLVATGADAEWLGELRGVLGESEPLALTQLDGLLVARYCGGDAQQARALFAAIWRAWRARGGTRPADPRVWAT